MIYIVGITLFVVCFLLLVSYIDWQKKMDWWEEFEYRRDEDEKDSIEAWNRRVDDDRKGN